MRHFTVELVLESREFEYARVKFGLISFDLVHFGRFQFRFALAESVTLFNDIMSLVVEFHPTEIFNLYRIDPKCINVGAKLAENGGHVTMCSKNKVQAQCP